MKKKPKIPNQNGHGGKKTIGGFLTKIPSQKSYDFL
jgi:hypothetical protein